VELFTFESRILGGKLWNLSEAGQSEKSTWNNSNFPLEEKTEENNELLFPGEIPDSLLSSVWFHHSPSRRCRYQTLQGPGIFLFFLVFFTNAWSSCFLVFHLGKVEKVTFE